MKHLILIFSLLFSNYSFANCQLDSKYDFILLSGPATHYLESLQLLKAPVKAISVFAGVNHFKGDILSGGLFLSAARLKKYKRPLIIFDQSREQRLDLSRSFNSTQLIEIETKDQGPVEVLKGVELKLDNFLINCEKEKKIFEQKIELMKNTVKTSSSFDHPIVFFLGEIKKGEKLPPMIMANDGFVKWLKQEKKILTYPTTLSYVSWSEKVLNNWEESLGKGRQVYFVGLSSKGSELKIAEVENSPQRKLFNITGPRLLTPGLAQMDFTLFLIKQKF